MTQIPITTAHEKKARNTKVYSTPAVLELVSSSPQYSTRVLTSKALELFSISSDIWREKYFFYYFNVAKKDEGKRFFFHF
jgi:hypothetical protein